MKRLAYIALLVMFLFSCKEDEKFIDNYTDTNKALLAVNTESGSSLQYMDLVDGSVLTSDIFSVTNGIAAPDSIGRIASFRDHIFVFFPKIYKIIVLTKDDFKVAGEVDFSAESLIPSDICFANATDAYVSHGNSNMVSLLDLTNFQVARKITVGEHPVAITASGNQIYTANRGDNTVSVIDSRTNKEEAVIQVAPFPTFIAVRPSGKECLVVSLGLGKTDGSGATKSPAMATFIDVATRNILKETPIGIGTINAVDALPLSLAVSEKDYAFIPIQENFMKVNLKTRTNVSNIGKYSYKAVANNAYNAVVVALKSTDDGVQPKAVVCNNVTGKKLYEAQLPNGTTWIHPIY